MFFLYITTSLKYSVVLLKRMVNENLEQCLIESCSEAYFFLFQYSSEVLVSFHFIVIKLI